MKNLIILFFATVTSFSLNAQTAGVTKPASHDKVASGSSADLAKQFVELGGIRKEIDLAINGGDAFLKKLASEKDPKIAAENKKVYDIVEPKWQEQKKSLAGKLEAELQKDFARNFSETELKYLVDLAKSAVFKKYRSFLESDTYAKVYGTPIDVVRGLVADTKKELSNQTPVKK